MACVSAASSQLVVANAESAGDPPRLVPWTRIGNITLGERRTRVESEYGSVGTGYHVLQRYGHDVQGYYLNVRAGSPALCAAGTPGCERTLAPQGVLHALPSVPCLW